MRHRELRGAQCCGQQLNFSQFRGKKRKGGPLEDDAISRLSVAATTYTLNRLKGGEREREREEKGGGGRKAQQDIGHFTEEHSREKQAQSITWLRTQNLELGR